MTTTQSTSVPGRGEADASAGPVALRGVSALRPLPASAVRIEPASELGAWQERNRTATLPHCVDQLERSGTLDNLRRLVKPSDTPFQGFWFADSDLHKTLEAIGWEAGRAGGEPYRTFLDTAVELLTRAQQDDGYLHSWVQGRPGQQRWVDLRWSHELYVAGHLIQAGIALARGARDVRLLGVARRFADLLVREFGEGGRELVDGHAEVETALVELYRETGHEPYLALARRQIELRGRGLLGEDRFGPAYFQDHLPVREATEATGHAVRQLYLAAGVTDLYLETGDASLLEAMERLWHSAFTTKLHVTGAHGSRHRDEAYGDPYELPPDRAYAETCAAIASFQWNWRMLLATGNARYAEEMERALYNAIAVATSVGGTEFFYSNPLQVRTGHDGSTEDAASTRRPWYACACCPPNLARLVASLHGYVATTDDTGVQLHLLTAGQVQAQAPDGSPVQVAVDTDYPWQGEIRLRASGGTVPWRLSIRLPSWCPGVDVTVDGTARDARTDERGYLHVDCPPDGETVVDVALAMPVRAVRAHPRVDAVRGTVALARGPLVYCLEQADQPPGALLEDIRLDPASLPQPGPSGIPGVRVELTGPAQVVSPGGDGLYADGADGDGADGDARRSGPAPIKLTAIPYFRWANRGEHAMRVWVPTT